MRDLLTWFASQTRTEIVCRRLRRICPHPEHRVFEFEHRWSSGLFCDDCQKVLVQVRVPLRLRRAAVLASR